ncbi:hypothetical protein GCM10010377_07140 [Streptomyces viridiviolaceus]|nr:hypothetical protein GCM10010377_07140 [Streptomyces viridiviolaceus]
MCSSIVLNAVRSSSISAAARQGCEVFAVDAARRVFRTPGLPVAAESPRRGARV